MPLAHRRGRCWDMRRLWCRALPLYCIAVVPAPRIAVGSALVVGAAPIGTAGGFFAVCAPVLAAILTAGGVHAAMGLAAPLRCPALKALSAFNPVTVQAAFLTCDAMVLASKRWYSDTTTKSAATGARLAL